MMNPQKIQDEIFRQIDSLGYLPPFIEVEDPTLHTIEIDGKYTEEDEIPSLDRFTPPQSGNVTLTIYSLRIITEDNQYIDISHLIPHIV